MSQTFVTVVVPFDAARIAHVEAVLAPLGNPPHPRVRAALDATGIVHFMSLNVVPAEPGAPANLLLEVSADGGHDAALRALAAALAADLARVLAAAGVPTGGASLYDVLYGHSRTIGPSWWATSGLEFAGTPGMSVERILKEDALAGRIAGLLDAQGAGWPAFRRLEHVRNAIWQAGDAKWAFVPAPTPCLAAAPESGLNPLVRRLFGEAVARKRIEPIAAARTVAKLAASAVAAFLWPLLALLVAVTALGGLLGGAAVACRVFLWTAALVVLGLAIGGVAAYVVLRRREERDVPEDREPDAREVAAVMANETFGAQNLLFSVSDLKPGRLRRVALRLAFWSVGLVGFFCRPGFLGTNRVIHFARWLVVPGTGQLVFLSNYDGTWQGYVGDFVTNPAGAHGVSSIWSNCRGFPRTRNLVKGADDRDRLVRWARRQQRPVPFWYSAYPHLTTDRIRTNAAIRQGLASASSQDDAADWLGCFGSAPQPADALEADEIPVLAFGGMRQLRFAACHLVRFSAHPRACRRWLAGIEPHVSYGENPGTDTALVVGLSASGLERLDLPDAARRTFPVAFQQGMTADYRARALGDTGWNAPAGWDWGGPRNDAADALMLVYADSPAALARFERRIVRRAVRLGHTIVFSQRLRDLPAGGPISEPFGFVDGVARPAIRGSRRATRARDVVAAGEFVLGYPDSIGRFPASPSIDAAHDPDHLLPDLGRDPLRQRPEFGRAHATGQRDLGRNGTYLVVRQFAQDANAFGAWLDQATAALGPSLPQWPDAALCKEFLAAKLVGRWRDGTSLVRHPDVPGTLAVPPARPDNAFSFGAEDPAGLRCPFGAHIRRANPRDSFAPGSRESLATVNTHRLLRVGRPYDAVPGRWPGLLFMCLNADVERQFEFVQGSWLMNPRFHGLANEVDPLLAHGGSTSLTVPTDDRPLHLRGLSDFVRVRGGGYFFLPGRTAFGFLARGRW
jgi:deferrochelatase/peroxidase EfeB